MCSTPRWTKKVHCSNMLKCMKNALFFYFKYAQFWPIYKHVQESYFLVPVLEDSSDCLQTLVVPSQDLRQQLGNNKKTTLILRVFWASKHERKNNLNFAHTSSLTKSSIFVLVYCAIFHKWLISALLHIFNKAAPGVQLTKIHKIVEAYVSAQDVQKKSVGAICQI